MAATTPFQIQELTGSPPHTLILRDRALPYQQVPFPRTLAAEIEFYQGNPVGVGQVLGPQHGKTTIGGMWKDRFLAASGSGLPPATLDGKGLGDAWAVIQAMEGFLERGQLLQVTWDEVVRVGWLTSFLPVAQRRQDWAWHAVFTWIGKGSQTTVPTSPHVGSDLASTQGDLQNRATQLSQAVSQPPIGVTSGLAASLDEQVSSIQGAIDGVAGAASGYATAALDTAGAVGRVVGLAQYLQQTAYDTADQIEGGTYATLTQFEEEDGGAVSLGRMLSFALYRSTVAFTSRQLGRSAARQAQSLAAQTSQPQILATIVLRQGQDLRSISTAYYGTPGQWQFLASFNGITGSSPAAGTLVVVPALTRAAGRPAAITSAATVGGGAA